MQRAKDLLQEFREAQNHLSVQSTIGSVQQQMAWKPPSSSAYKLNVDAIVFTGMDASGFGVMVCNEKGEVMAALAGNGPLV